MANSATLCFITACKSSKEASQFKTQTLIKRNKINRSSTAFINIVSLIRLSRKWGGTDIGKNEFLSCVSLMPYWSRFIGSTPPLDIQHHRSIHITQTSSKTRFFKPYSSLSGGWFHEHRTYVCLVICVYINAWFWDIHIKESAQNWSKEQMLKKIEQIITFILASLSQFNIYHSILKFIKDWVTLSSFCEITDHRRRWCSSNSLKPMTCILHSMAGEVNH